MTYRRPRYHRKCLLTAAVGILFIIALSACADRPGTDDEQFINKWKAKVDESRPTAPRVRKKVIDLPERQTEKESAPAEKKAADRSQKRLPSHSVSLNMRNAPVDAVIRALARSAGVNVMLTSRVNGEVDVNVTGTPWDQVFESLLATNALEYEWQGDIVRVISLEDMKLDQELEKTRKAQIKASQERKEVEPLLMRVIKLDYANAQLLAPTVEKLLTGATGSDGNHDAIRGSVTVDTESNALVVHAIADDITKMITLVEQLDRPAIQVLIEANIVETTRDVARELGIQWGGLYRSTVNGNNYWLTPGLNSSGIMDGTLDTPVNPTSGMAANFPADLADSGTGMSLGFVTESLGDYILNVQLSALEDEQKLNILSSPSITTLDNQKAVIESGARIPFQTVDDDGDINTEFEEAVLKLEVTPHVINNQVLKLNIITNKDEVDFSRTVLGNPTIITTQAETNLILHDGQTTVIGGLTKQTDTDSRSGMPWLKDIPGLGYLFKSISNSTQMEDVLIFITPHIIKDKRGEMENQS